MCLTVPIWCSVRVHIIQPISHGRCNLTAQYWARLKCQSISVKCIDGSLKMGFVDCGPQPKSEAKNKWQSVFKTNSETINIVKSLILLDVCLHVSALLPNE